MGLKEYRAKRNFTKTPEPAGKTKKVANLEHRFFIQKHNASHLHYDFRLEIDGVLKSWAIPKGPSVNPKEKRLAMMVEDHPMEYGNFEGNIPKGNYGAGSVMLWDEGTFHVPGVDGYDVNEKQLKKMLHEGNVKLVLSGKKINGEFALVKTKRPNGKGNEWLLIKKADDYSSQEDIIKKDRSIISNRTMEEIKNESKEEWYSPVKKDFDYKGAPKKKMPSGVKPMLATLTDKPFNNSNWVFEIKWDGFRAIAEVDYNSVDLYSRNNLPFNNDFPEVVDGLRKLGIQAVFDGELVVLDDTGLSSFQLIQNYKRTGKGKLAYYIFDILFLNGHDLTNLTLVERKEILKEILPEKQGIIRFSDHIPEIGAEFYKKAAEQNLEGIIAKKASSTYQYGKRVSDWLKIKIVKQQEAVIVGFTEPRGSRKKFGALVLGVYEGDELVYIGHSGGGFNNQSLQEIYDKLIKLKVSECPFKKKPKTNMPVQWVSPEMVCEVKFQEWTSDGIMRQPIFLGLREDKKPSEVVKELPEHTGSVLKKEEVKATPKMRSTVDRAGKKTLKKTEKSTGESNLFTEESFINKGKDALIDFKNFTLKVTNLNKVLWPEEGYTKRDLLEYYDRISDWILPYLKDRPESLRRTPNGIGTKDFFQKNMPSNIPDWLKTEKLFSESTNADVNYLICNDKPTLLYMANLGCIEINPWSSRLGNLDNPDYSVIDLDPNGATFDQVIEVANAVKAVLDRAGIIAYPKTSGSRGIHIYIPMGGKYDYEQVKDFTLILVKLVQQLVPDLTSLERTPAKRKNPIYLDYLQNRKGQTLAAPYCLRPKSGATVSTPLQWNELKPGLHPSQFNIQTIFDRLKETGDIFSPVLLESINMEKALKKVNKE